MSETTGWPDASKVRTRSAIIFAEPTRAHQIVPSEKTELKKIAVGQNHNVLALRNPFTTVKKISYGVQVLLSTK